ncbi:MAG: IS66 family insertion sequence element accessory protein TnpB [Faecalibacterium sp.]
MNQELQMLSHAQKAELWSHRVAECRNSNISVNAWCEQNGLNPKTYYYWQRKLFNLATQAQAEQNNFVELRGCALSDTNEVVASIELPAGTAKIYRGADAQTIAAICQGMRQC